MQVLPSDMRTNPAEDTYDPREEMLRAQRQAIYESSMVREFEPGGQFVDGKGLRLDVRIIPQVGMDALRKLISQNMFGKGIAVQQRSGFVHPGSTKPTTEAIRRAAVRYQDVDRLLRNRQAYEETLAISRKSGFYRVLREPTAAGLKFTVWPLPPGVHSPLIFDSREKAESKAAQLEKTSPLKTGKWWSAKKDPYTMAELGAWMPRLEVFQPTFVLETYSAKNNPDDTAISRGIAKTTLKYGGRAIGKGLVRAGAKKAAKKVAVKTAGKIAGKTGARMAVKLGAKAGSKYVPYVGWAIAAADAAPVAIQEGGRVISDIEHEVEQARKHTEAMKKEKFIPAVAKTAVEAGKTSLRMQWSGAKATARTGLALLTARELAEATYTEDKMRKNGLRARRNPIPTELQEVMAHLRAAQWFYWTAHWAVSGQSFYGDHLLLQRLYEGLNEPIDELGERLIAYYGPMAANPITINGRAQQLLESTSGQADLLRAALMMETALQKSVRVAWKANQSAEDMSLGLDDFLMGLAKDRDTAIYLLRQRTR